MNQPNVNKPDSFFHKSKGFKAKEAAVCISGDLAIGPEGDTWAYENGVWKPAPGIIKDRLTKLLGDRYRRGHLSTVTDIVMSPARPRIPASPFEETEWHPWINLRNGEYNWQTGTLEEHDPASLSTVQLPFSYDPTATAPRFKAWMDEVVPAELHALVLEVFGYLLMSGNPLQHAFLLLGPGGTGKSTFLRVLERMLGRHNVSSQSLKALSTDRFAGAELFGKIANIRSDIESSYMADSTLFKQLTGGDTLSAQRKYAQPFDFRPWATPIFSANKTWRSEDDTTGYIRRWVILPFETVLDRTKPFDETTLYAEAAGIFNVAMHNLRRLHARNEFEIMGAAREALENFAKDSDGVRLWLAEDDTVNADARNESMRCERSAVYQQYKLWTVDVNGSHPKSANEFYKSLEALGYQQRRASNGRFMVGIDLAWVTV